MTATEGFEEIKHLVDQGCDKVIVCNGGCSYDVEYGGEAIDGSYLLLIMRDLLAEVGQFCAEHKTTSAVSLKVIAAPTTSDMLVMGISRQDNTIVINVKERADG